MGQNRPVYLFILPIYALPIHLQRTLKAALVLCFFLALLAAARCAFEVLLFYIYIKIHISLTSVGIKSAFICLGSRTIFSMWLVLCNNCLLAMHHPYEHLKLPYTKRSLGFIQATVVISECLDLSKDSDRFCSSSATQLYGWKCQRLNLGLSDLYAFP